MICGFSRDAFSELFLFYIFSALTVVCGGGIYICLSECEYVYVGIGVMEVRGQKHWMPLEQHAVGSYSV